MLIINSVVYNSYFDMCKEFNIDYKSFIEYKKSNADISELDLLAHFIPNIAVRMDNGNYIEKEGKKTV